MIRRPLTILCALVAASVSVVTATAMASATEDCPNASIRIGPSAALADCRAYELVSPDLNHAKIPKNGVANGKADLGGTTLVYAAQDAPDNANSAQALSNLVRATRDPSRGWSGVSLSPPLRAPVTAYQSTLTIDSVAADLMSTFVTTDEPLSRGPIPGGQNSFVGRPDGTYQLVTNVGTPFSSSSKVYSPTTLIAGSDDYSHVYFQPPVLQGLPLDTGGPYSWSEQHGLRLVGILPDGTPAPNGASLVGGTLRSISSDGQRVLFRADGKLYLRMDDSRTVEVSASQRTVDPDPNPLAIAEVVGVVADGSKVLFTSKSELTNNANTGRSSGLATDAGRDLYLYNVATGKLTDLTVDTSPADQETGANLQVDGGGNPFVWSSLDGAYVYFMARGDLSDGAVSGHPSIYVWHEGDIKFVADADGFAQPFRAPGSVYVTPNGRHIAFASFNSLTGYDNTDPITGQLHAEIFKVSLGSNPECVSCRPNGTRPTADSSLPVGFGGRSVSDDGRRVFFNSEDAVLPQASSGLRQVFQYSNGSVSPISRVDSSSSAFFLDSSASGDDVFFTTSDDLVPGPNAGDDAVFDARVGGGFRLPETSRCSGVECRGSGTPSRTRPLAASVAILGVDGSAPETSVGSNGVRKVTVSKVRTIRGSAGSLKVTVPGKGRLIVSGRGLQTRRTSPPGAQTVSVRLALTKAATSTLRTKRLLKTNARVWFSDAKGQVSSVTLAVTFKLGLTRRRAS